MFSLKPFLSKAAGLPDLLNYALLVDEGIVICKDGSLIGGFSFRGKDSASSTEAELNYVASRVATVLASFGDGWSMWVDAVRIPAPGYPAPSESHFPDAVTALIDAERRELFEQKGTFYETELMVLLQYLPPSKTESKLGELLYNDESSKEDSHIDRVLAAFKRRLANFQGGLGSLLNMKRLGMIRAGTEECQYDSDQLVNYLHFALHGEAVALRIPECPLFLDSWLGMESLWPGDVLKLGKKYVSCVTIEGFPAESHPEILSVLRELRLPYRFSTRFIFMDRHQAKGALEKFQAYWDQNVRKFSDQLMRREGIVNLDAARMAKEAEISMSDVESGEVGFGYYMPVIILMSEDLKLVQEQALYVKDEIEKRGYAARVEDINTMEAWLGALPGHYRQNVRRPVMHSLNLGHLLPLSAIWTGLSRNPCPFYPDNSPPLARAITTGGTPFNVNVHVGDVGHILVLGPIGSGKSTLLSFGLAQSRRYKGATVSAFDKGRSLYTLCSAVGGQHYDIGSDFSGMVLCPLADIEKDSDKAWAFQWIDTCFTLQTGSALSSLQQDKVNGAINRLAESERGSRSLTNFVSKVQDQEVKQALINYTISGKMGHLLDGDEDSLGDSNFSVFEIDELMRMPDKNKIPVLLYLFRRFERSLNGQPAFLSLDEAWVILAHPVFREKLQEWLKELRKKNCSVIIATQSLSDAVRSGILDVLLESCATKVYLPNNDAASYGTKDNPGPAAFYKAFGLNDREIMLLKDAEYKKQYYWTSSQGSRLIEFDLGPLALSFVAVSDMDTLNEVKTMEKTYGTDWPVNWMKQRGVNYEKYLRR